MHINLEDPCLVDKIVNEVKSQGVFDQFRRDCMSDVDTKPAYQNLRQRVEISVGKFLSEQVWTPDTNKIQLREKLRKHITESGFLDTGVERIVDQVVNPKVSTTFQPQIEDIAYEYLGIEKPEDNEETTSSYTNGNIPHEVDLMPTDLEAVSPDSDKTTNKSNEKNYMNDSDEKAEDEEESPPFEPLEGRPPSPEEDESNESKLSAISGLTSQDSVKSEVKSFSFKPTEECQLSQVSSSSHLSILSNDGEEFGIISKQLENDISEEAQMPKFFENSDINESKSLHFDINKDKIKFEGTERGSAIHSLSEKSNVELEVDTADTNQSERTSQNSYSEFPNSSTSDNDNDSEKPLKIMTDVSQSDSMVLPMMEKVGTNEEISKCFNSNQDKSHSHSPTLKIESGNEKDIQKSNADNEANKKKSKHENDTKNNFRPSSKEHRSSYKDRHRSNSHKTKSESSSKSEKSSGNEKDNNTTKQKRTKEKAEKINDDHFSSKQKIIRRKSTDSNDGDNVADEYKYSTTLGNTSNVLTESTNNSKLSDIGSNSSNSNIGTSTHSSNEKKLFSFHCDKLRKNLRPVILDEFLNNNNVRGIELAIGGKLNTNCLQINNPNMIRKVNNEKIEEKSEDVSESNIFEWDANEKEDFKVKIKKLSAATEKNEYNVYVSCDDKSFAQAFEYFSMHVIEIKNNFNYINSDSEISVKKKSHKNSVSDTFDENVPDNKFHSLLVEGKNKRKMNSQGFTDNKRKRFSESSSIFAYNNDQLYNNQSLNLINNCTKNSKIVNKKLESLNHKCHINAPSTDSDLCFGLRENVSSTSDAEKIQDTIVNEKGNILIKNNQRYSSEDLYKPRLALCQRSRRRGVDTCEF